MCEGVCAYVVPCLLRLVCGRSGGVGEYQRVRVRRCAGI